MRRDPLWLVPRGTLVQPRPRCRPVGSESPLDEKQINARQYTILSQLLDRGRPLSLDEIRQAPWYTSLYLKRNDKTRSRDLNRLREMALVFLDTDNALWPGFITPKNIKLPGRKK